MNQVSCPACTKLLYNKETRIRDGRVYHVKCAPKMTLAALFGEMTGVILSHGVEFRFATQERGPFIFYQVRVVREGYRLANSESSYSPEDALDIILDPYRGKITPADTLELTSRGGNGVDCIICEGRENPPEQYLTSG